MRKIFFDLIKEGCKPILPNNERRLYFPVSRSNPHQIDFWVGIEINKKIPGYSIDFYIDRILTSGNDSGGRRVLTHCLTDNAIESLPSDIKDKLHKFILDIFDADEI